jgi:hypothetical protein
MPPAASLRASRSEKKEGKIEKTTRSNLGTKQRGRMRERKR